MVMLIQNNNMDQGWFIIFVANNISDNPININNVDINIIINELLLKSDDCNRCDKQNYKYILNPHIMIYNHSNLFGDWVGLNCKYSIWFNPLIIKYSNPNIVMYINK